MNKTMPVFVRIDEYKEVLDTIALTKEKLADAKALLNEISELKEQEDSELESWKVNLEDIDKKIQYIDGALFEPNM